jgi:3-dehydro-L-gulonate 2-dehydrogenase
MSTRKLLTITYDQLKSEFTRILKKYGFDELRAEKCAEIFAINTLEGVHTHGVNRFPRFISNIKDGYVRPDTFPIITFANEAVEQWDGNLGPGPLNAVFATDRATDLASKYGIGLVGLANTNHWMRGGTYGWQAARKGFVLIAWTNTEANMPAWGAKAASIGNNPFVIAVPYKNEAVVLDFAMTQFSYGKLEAFQSRNEKLPFPGGYDSKGELTTDPSAILQTWRALPIGYWKGSGLSLLLDILAAVLSGGKSTHEITKSKVEYAVSQVFIAICREKLKNHLSIENTIDQIITDLQKSIPENDEAGIRYPGENVIRTRNNNLKSGIPVNKDIWNKVQEL